MSKEPKLSEKKRRHSNASESDRMQEDFKETAAEPAKNEQKPLSAEAIYEKDVQISIKAADEVTRALDTTNVDLLIQGFTHLREHLRICNRPDGSDVSVQARVLQESCRRVIYEWAAEASSRDFREIARAWQLASSQSVIRLEMLIPSTVAGLLATLDTHEAHRMGNKLVSQILSEQGRTLMRAFGTPRSSTCASVLQLLYQIVVYSHGEHADQLWHSFNWTMGSLDSLPTIRSNVMGFSIRRLWIRYVLAFFAAERCKMFVEILKTRTIFSSLFNGVEGDSYQELHALLSSVYQNVVLNEEVPRADKVRVFGIHLMGKLAKVANNVAVVDPHKVGVARPETFVPKETADDSNVQLGIAKDSISALVIRFFRGMMTFPGHGICFHQYGLYPAPRKWTSDQAAPAPAMGGDENEDDVFAESRDMQDVAVMSKGATMSGMRDLCNSQILRILVGCINPAATKRMGDLATEILRASPELVAPFWRNYSCSFEPRLSLRYLGNTAFAMKVMGLPLPLPRDSDARSAEPPRLNTLVEHILPFPLLRTSLGRGLQMRSSPLVRYRNLLLIDLALRKLTEVRDWMQMEARATSDTQSVEMNAWTRMDRRLLNVVKQRIPEWKVVMALHSEINAADSSTGTLADADQGPNEDALREAECQHALLDNVLMKVIYGYQTHFSDLVMEANFEFGKLISDIRLSDDVLPPPGGGMQKRRRNPIKAHTLLYLLHALSTTPASSTKWMARTKQLQGADDQSATGQHTNIGVVMLVYLFAVQPELRLAARKVCLWALRSTGLFDHDASGDAALSEASCWLDALAAIASPHANRNKQLAAAVAEGSLERGHALVAFIEDALGHASRLPYKYADRVHSSMAHESTHLDSPLPFSPLLSAVVEAAVLKVATGNGPLATLLRDQPLRRIAAEMQTNPMYAYIREIVCRIAEFRGQETALYLRRFLSDAARSTLAPRLAKLDDAKTPKKAGGERSHYEHVGGAFLDLFMATQGYLMVIGAPPQQCIGSSGNDAPNELPKKVSKKLQARLIHTCGDIGSRLASFIDEMVGVLHENSDVVTTTSLTLWLLAQIQALKEVGVRNSAFVVAISWISQYERICAQNHQSLWDTPVFVALAPEILQIDDMSFLVAMFRHLLASKSLPTLLHGEPVRRLLVHILLANRGSVGFCGIVLHLLQRIVGSIQGTDLAGSASMQGDEFSFAVSFVHALTVEHLDSFPKGEENHSNVGNKQLNQALEIHAATFDMRLHRSGEEEEKSNRELQRILDFNAAVLARKSAQVWLSSSPQEARRMWQPFTARIANDVPTYIEDLGQQTAAVGIDLPSLVCVVSPAMTQATRLDVLQVFSTAALQASAPLTLCAMANVVFTLLYDTAGGDTASGCAVDVPPQVQNLLSSRVIGLWARSLDSEDGNAKASLEWTARLVTKHSEAVSAGILGIAAFDPSALCKQIKHVKLQLPEFERAYSAGDGVSIDIASMAEHMYERAKDGELYAEDTAKHQLLGRIMASDSVLRRDAYKWAEMAFSSKRHTALTRAMYAVWFLCNLAYPFVRESEFGLFLWDDSQESRDTRDLCLLVGARLFAGINPVLLKSMTSSGTVFLADVVVQHHTDQATVDDVCRKIGGMEKGRLLLPQAHVVRSSALRVSSLSDQTAMVLLNSMKGIYGLAQDLVPALGDRMAEDATQIWESVSVLASAAEYCWSVLENSFTMNWGEKSQSVVSETVHAAFSCIDAVVRSMCYSFENAADVDATKIQQLVEFYPAAVYRFLAFASHAVGSLSTRSQIQSSTAKHSWFSVLRRMLGCRLFNDRMYTSGLRNSLALVVSALWDLSSPALSRWSASLDDYFTLSELEALVGAFGGSCSLSDSVLLHVISGYESVTGQSVQRVALCFGPRAADIYVKEKVNRARYLIERNENDIGVVDEDVVSNAMATIDQAKLFRSILNFSTRDEGLFAKDPVARLLDAVRISTASGGSRNSACDAPSDSEVYNTWYVLAWLWSVVSSGHRIDPRRLIDCNAAGFALVALSSENLQSRKLAYYILDLVYPTIEADNVRFAGQRQCLLLLNSVCNTLTERREGKFPQIPFAAALFAATSLYTMIHPEHVMYTEINRLLLKGPCLRMNEIPLLKTVLHSSTSTYKQRIHVLRLASQSSKSFDQEGRSVIKRSHLVSTLLTLASSSLGDVQTARSAITLLFNMTSADNPETLIRHVSKKEFSLLAWIREQVALELNAMQQMAGLASIESEAAASVGGGGPLASAVRGIKASVVNLTVLMRIVVRAIANYPLTRLHGGQLVYNSFWVLQASEQAGAVGQSTALDLAQQILRVIAWSLSRTKTCADKVHVEVARPILVLVRVCLDMTMLLADMQLGASGSEHSHMLDAQSIITHEALVSLGMLEHAIESGTDGSAASVDPQLGAPRVHYDPCSVAAIAGAKSVESLFQSDPIIDYSVTAAIAVLAKQSRMTAGMVECYRQCVDRLFSLCFSLPWTAVMREDVAEVVSRALVIDAPSSLNVSAWIRECKH
ncbi:hypothetical protein EV175_001909 [Coemansia sp. RSA 1933]|nr:hypothetical protein EV175_001909 [Coemansia sp. RSA 1933]